MENETQATEAEQQQSPMITLQLDLNEVNFVLTALGKEQFNTVAPLINKIRNQGIAQLQPQPA